MDRRRFCLTSAAAAISGATVGVAALAAERHSDSSIRPYKFIYDRRYPASRAFGAASEYIDSLSGTASIGGDITEIWSQDLRLRWSAGEGVIAGMTTARTLLCLEQLAQDHWMRVVIRAEHSVREGRAVVHRVKAAYPMLARMTSALAAADWPSQMPAALAACAGARGACRTIRVLGSLRGLERTTGDGQLVSFVIA